jgi:hypothetical protein
MHILHLNSVVLIYHGSTVFQPPQSRKDVDIHKCANMEFGLHHQVPSIESILGSIWSKKFKAQSKREEGDGASPAQTSLAGFCRIPGVPRGSE